MSQIFNPAFAGALPPNVPLQFIGDNGTIAIPAANTIRIFAGNGTLTDCGATVFFRNSLAISRLNLTDTDDNTLLGKNAGNISYTGARNTSLGFETLRNLTSGSDNIAIGHDSSFRMTTGQANTAIGGDALFFLTTGSDNIAIGFGAGVNYSTSETRNICIGESGRGGDNGVIRIGTNAFQTTCFISGINGNTLSNSLNVVIDPLTNQLATSTPASFSSVWANDVGNPTDATTYYFEPSSSAFSITDSTSAVVKIFIPVDTTLRSIYGLFQVTDTLGSNEACTVFIRVNDTTNFNITTTLTLDSADVLFNGTALNIILSAGDFISLGFTSPTWATEPLFVRLSASIFCY